MRSGRSFHSHVDIQIISQPSTAQVIGDDAYLDGEFIQVVQQRGAAIIKVRGGSRQHLLWLLRALDAAALPSSATQACLCCRLPCLNSSLACIPLQSCNPALLTPAPSPALASIRPAACPPPSPPPLPPATTSATGCWARQVRGQGFDRRLFVSWVSASSASPAYSSCLPCSQPMQIPSHS